MLTSTLSSTRWGPSPNTMIALQTSCGVSAHDATFLNYLSDTQGGSSGSPVFNDQLQVVALHHAAIKAGGKDANQGVRISTIFSTLDQMQHTNPQARTVLRFLRGISERADAAREEEEEADEAAEGGEGVEAVDGVVSERDFSSSSDIRKGYQPGFLGPGLSIPFPSSLRPRATLKTDPRQSVLHYTHFSIAVDDERRQPQVTAVNIHGGKMRSVKGSEMNTTFTVDNRLDRSKQLSHKFYTGLLGNSGVAGVPRYPMSRGHMVRRMDPGWADKADRSVAVMANQDTYAITNGVSGCRTQLAFFLLPALWSITSNAAALAHSRMSRPS